MLSSPASLISCMATLNRFLSKLGERGLPFSKLLKKQDKFEWSQEAVVALEDLKQHLQSPPVLTTPIPGEEHTYIMQLLLTLSARVTP